MKLEWKNGERLFVFSHTINLEKAFCIWIEMLRAMLGTRDGQIIRASAEGLTDDYSPATR